MKWLIFTCYLFMLAALFYPMMEGVSSIGWTFLGALFGAVFAWIWRVE